MKRLRPVAAGFCAGILVGVLFALSVDVKSTLRDYFSLNGHAETAEPASESGHEHEHGEAHDHGDGHEEEDSKIAMAPEQIEGARIDIKAAGSGLISKHLRVPGTIIPDRNRVGRVPSKVIGTVAELKKRLGDRVSAGEVIAILDSREVADAKSEYIAATVNFRLQTTLYEREKTLWDKRVSSEQRLLKAQATHQEAQVRRDAARQKLSALGVSEDAIVKLEDSEQSTSGLERYEIKAPIGGRIVEQLVDIGTPMGAEGQAHELYAIADLSTVWIELTISTQDLPQIQEGQRLTIEANGSDSRSVGTIIFTSPLLNQDTRSARVIASVENDDGMWRPGSFVTADIAVSEAKADLVVPKAALQTINGETLVFIRTDDGFEGRHVTLGSDDENSVEVVSGLKAGEKIATANTFLLKAELGKSEAEHAH
jgi:cobalt-zinc-cadmium efflux system membrane fusion protein